MTWRNDPPTDKQLEFIRAICEELRMKYEMPKSKGEAANFIDENRIYFLRSKYDWGDERESSPS